MFTRLSGLIREIKSERELMQSDVANLDYVNAVLIDLRKKVIDAVRVGEKKILILRWEGENLNPAQLSVNRRLIYEAFMYEGFEVTLVPQLKQRGKIEFISMFILLR